MSNPYKFWADSLEGREPKMFVDSCELGFYRKKIMQRDAKGNNKHIGWTPVAIFMNGDVMTARIGPEDTGRDVIGDEMNELWSYVAQNPISEVAYREVARFGKPFPDDKLPPVSIPEIPPLDPIERIIGRAHNEPSVVLPELAHAEAIDNAIAAAIKTVANETEAAQALGSKNRIAELRLAADKAGKAIYEPIYRDYKKIQGVWSPIVTRAVAAEGKLQTAILTFRESERKRIAKEQVEADRKQREIDEANQRAADRSIARGEPEAISDAVEAAPVVTAPLPVQPTYGTRKLKEEVKTFLDSVTDYDQVYAYFKESAEMKTFLTTLATAAVKAGRTVPGVTTRQGLI